MTKVFVNSLLDSSLDDEVYKKTIKNHSQESLSLLKFGNLNISNISTSLLQRVQASEAEISPFHGNDISCDEVPQSGLLAREASLASYSNKKLPLSSLKKLLLEAFATLDNRRPYPSAGALYPIEPLIFLFPEGVSEFSKKAGCYHFRAISKTLQLIKPLDKEFFYNEIFHNLIAPSATPCFSILYVMLASKAIFKYRYRGYRHALMEAGSMYQNATIVSQKIGLRTTLWSSFSDHQLSYMLDLDPLVYLPVTMQLFGYEDEH